MWTKCKCLQKVDGNEIWQIDPKLFDCGVAVISPKALAMIFSV